MVLVLAFVCQVEPVPANQAPRQSENPANNQATPAIKTPNRATETAITTDNQKPAPDNIRRSEYVQIFISGFVALVILWQAWIYNQQRKIMREQKRMSATSERAYMGVKHLEINPIINNTLTVTVIIQNGGKTPAWDYRAKCRAGLEETAPLQIDWGSCPAPERGSFVPAGGEKDSDFGPLKGITQEMVDAINSKKLTLFIDAECRYLDHLGNRQVFTFGYSFELGGDKARALERYQTHHTENPD